MCRDLPKKYEQKKLYDNIALISVECFCNSLQQSVEQLHFASIYFRNNIKDHEGELAFNMGLLEFDIL